MKNYISDGDLIDYTASGSAVNSGDFVFISASLFGFATNNIAIGATAPIKTKGKFSCNKASGDTWAVGSLLYWDNTAKNFTVVSTSNTKVGVATMAVAPGVTTGHVRLTEATA